MSYAIIRTGGKQYRVSQGQRLRVEKLRADVGAQVELKDVLAHGAGEGLTLGGTPVQAKVIAHGRGPKINIWTYKRRNGEQRRMGHRQDFTEIEILTIPGA